MKATKKTTTKKATAKTSTKVKATRPATAKATKPAKDTKPVATTAAKKLSQVEAAIQVLANAGEPMNCKAMVDAMVEQGLWTSPAGKTPAATLYASILRDINTKGKDARFKKVDRGQFVLATSK